MFVTSRPHVGSQEPITRRNILSDSKLVTEGTLDKVQVMLGWLLDAYALILLLPNDKYDA
jgi:hypothetical protein